MSDETIRKSELVAIREGVESDLPFIYASWLKGLRYGNDTFGAIQQDAYFKCYHQVLERVLENQNTSIRIACLKDEPDAILGYSVSTGDILHFVFVKRSWRRIGIAKDLVNMCPPKTVTHITKVGESILNKLPGVSFNPFVL